MNRSSLFLLLLCVGLWCVWVMPGVVGFASEFDASLLMRAFLLTQQGASGALLRSSLIVGIVLPALVVGAVLLAALVRAAMSSPLHRAICASALLAPTLGGPVIFAFFWRRMFPSLAYGAGVISDLLALLPWALTQACPLMAGFLITATNARMRREERYGAATGLPKFRVALLSLVGHQKWFISGFSFVLGALLFHERILTELALRPSPGSGNEMVSHALSRIYQLVSLSINPVVAAQLSFVYALIAAVVAMGVVVLATLLAVKCLAFLSQHWARRFVVRSQWAVGLTLAFIVLLWVPGFTALPSVRSPLVEVALLREHLFATCLCALLVLMVGAAAGAASFQRWALSGRSAVGEVGIVLFLVVPPTAIGLGWMYSAGHIADAGPAAFRLTWMLAVIATYFPLGFLLSTFVHRYIDPRAYRYARRAGIGAVRFEEIAFLRAFPSALVALFAVFALGIWSDWGASAAFAGAINVFAERLVVAVSGRAESLPMAASLSWITVSICAIASAFIARASLQKAD